jgi:hypothetical protein
MCELTPTVMHSNAVGGGGGGRGVLAWLGSCSFESPQGSPQASRMEA